MACPGLSHQSANAAMSALQMAGRCLAMFLGTLSLKNVFSTVFLDSYFGKCSDVRCRHLQALGIFAAFILCVCFVLAAASSMVIYYRRLASEESLSILAYQEDKGKEKLVGWPC